MTRWQSSKLSQKMFCDSQHKKSENTETKVEWKKNSTYSTKYINTLLIYPKKNKRYPEAKNKQRKKIKFPGALRHPSKRQTQSKNKKKSYSSKFLSSKFLAW